MHTVWIVKMQIIDRVFNSIEVFKNKIDIYWILFLNIPLNSATIVSFSAILSNKVLFMLLVRWQCNRIQPSIENPPEVFLNIPFVIYQALVYYVIFFLPGHQAYPPHTMHNHLPLNSAFGMCYVCNYCNLVVFWN